MKIKFSYSQKLIITSMIIIYLFTTIYTCVNSSESNLLISGFLISPLVLYLLITIVLNLVQNVFSKIEKFNDIFTWIYFLLYCLLMITWNILLSSFINPEYY